MAVSLIAYQESQIALVWIKWTVVTLSLAYLMPLTYMITRVYILTHSTGTHVSFRSFFRENPNEMLIIACIFGLPSTVTIYFLGYPTSIIATLVGLAVTTLLIALVNRVYRVSLHLALLSNLVVPLTFIFGLSSLSIFLPLIALLGASRYYLGEHTPAQLATGFLVGLVVAFGILKGFGILVLG
jgi:membrane-associated phospholipid phosphatase